MDATRAKVEMDDYRSRILSRFDQEIFPPPSAGLQERKSAQTRQLLLEATISCLQEVGYARTTTQLIAEYAKTSRGAMLHHYPTKASLIRSVVDYTFYKRLESLIEGTYEIEAKDDPDRLEKHWSLFTRNLQSREYAAYLELAIAARTDSELREIFIPKARLYDEVWRLEVQRLPAWRERPEALRLAIDLAHAATEGMLLNADIWDSSEREYMVNALIRYVVTLLRNGELSLEQFAAPPAKPPRRRARAKGSPR